MENFTHLLKANSLCLADYGVLILGKAGAGKSALTLALLERAVLFGRKGLLIGDDYSLIVKKNEALYAQNPPHIAGGLEIRGAGVFQMPFVAEAKLHLVVELKGKGERYPQGHHWFCEEEQKNDKSLNLPLLKLPQVDKADMMILCQAVEAYLFKMPYPDFSR